MDQPCVKQLGTLYQSSCQGRLILDVRPAEQFLQLRLSKSVNIPLIGLTKRCYLLPDKATAFSVVLPPPATYTVTVDQSQHGSSLADGSTAVWLKGADSLPDFLSSRGWTAVSAYLQDGPELWAAAAGLAAVEQGPPADPHALARRCLFAPSSVLSDSIEQVEAALLAQVEQQQQHQQRHQQQQSQPNELGDVQSSSHIFCALDVGCGSGRDVAWLASRQPGTAGVVTQQAGQQVVQQVQQEHAQQDGHHIQQQQQQHQHQQHQRQDQKQHVQAAVAGSSVGVHWHVTGLDEWLGALERAAELAEAMHLGPDRVRLAFARICPDTGAIQQLQVPHKSKLRQSALAACPASDQSSTLEGCPPAVEPQALGSAHQFDLVICCRFLVRALLPTLARMLVPGGFIVYNTFLDLPGVRAFGRPFGADHLLQPGELAGQHFGSAAGFDVLRDEVVVTPDGREVCCFLARKHSS